MTSEIEQAVLAAVDDQRIVEELESLVRIPSVDGTAAESAAQAWCAERLSDLGLTVDHWQIDLDDLRADPDYPGMEGWTAPRRGAVSPRSARTPPRR